MRMLNKSPLTVKKFCTNWEESCESTAKTPASLTMDARNSARTGKAKNAAMPDTRDGMPTRRKVMSWNLCLSDFDCPTALSAIVSMTDDSLLALSLTVFEAVRRYVDEEKVSAVRVEIGVAVNASAVKAKAARNAVVMRITS